MSIYLIYLRLRGITNIIELHIERGGAIVIIIIMNDNGVCENSILAIVREIW